MLIPRQRKFTAIGLCLFVTALMIFIIGHRRAQTITLPDGTTLNFHSISIGERMDKSLGISEYFEVRYAHAPLPILKDSGGTITSNPERHSTSAVQIRLRYSGPAESNWDVYLVDGQGIESKARVKVSVDYPRRESEGPNEQGWFLIDAYYSRQDSYHLRFRPSALDYDPWDIPSLPLMAEWKVKNTAKVNTASEKGSPAPLVAKQGRVELLMKRFVRRRQPRQDADERTLGEFEVRHPFKAELPYTADTKSMTIWDQSGNMMHFNGPVNGGRNRIKLWDRDTFMSDDDCYRVSVDLYRRPTVPELFNSNEVFCFSHIPAPGREAIVVGSSLVVGGRKLTLERVTPTGKERSGLVLTGNLPAPGERLILVDAIDDHGRRLAGIESKPGAQILRDSAIGIEDKPITEVVFPFELSQDTSWFSVDFAFDKPLTFEFKVAPEFVD
uniref:hypothetical protein n=1 Tax=Prosthecobacter sp. TaxID=1965333 RepID=UPI0037847523